MSSCDLPSLLPPNYRIEYRFFFLPLLMNGTYHWCSWIPVVQRLVDTQTPVEDRSGLIGQNDYEWADVGFWDEVRGQIGKDAGFRHQWSELQS